MKYKNIVNGRFLERPNRFIAHVEINGKQEVCHVKNTGRCRELLQPGVQVFLQVADKPERKTKYDLIGVVKNGMIINIDSQIPNRVVEEWLKSGNPLFDSPNVRREKKYGNSRFDLYIEDGDRKAFIEVKGVTLEDDGIARFPDAPTERGVKHIKELQNCIQEGYEAYVFFVIQMKGIRQMQPNWNTHEAFGMSLVEAEKAGVKILAYDCLVTENAIEINAPVPVYLGGSI